MYYSIFDKDTRDYLHTGRNSKTERECLEEYLAFREPDIGEWFNDNEKEAPKFHAKYKNLSEDSVEDEKWGSIFEEWCKEVSDKFIVEDMEMCNFALEKHSDKIPED